MFDIHDYYNDSLQSIEDTDLQVEVGDIDEDISSDIDSLLKNRFDSLYLKDKFKKHASTIELIYPRIAYSHHRALIKSPDHIRFLLSLYPYKSDLENIEKIVLKPRHVVLGSVELMSLYMRQKKILVLYLHQPHMYRLHDSSMREYAEFMPMNIQSLLKDGQIANTVNTQKKDELKIPPLWYIMSLIQTSDDDRIDKFFIKRGGKFGFVSSHAANTFAGATFIAKLVDIRSLRWFMYSWAAVVSYSRIYLGVHYPADIIGGALLGIFLGLIIVFILKKWAIKDDQFELGIPISK